MKYTQLLVVLISLSVGVKAQTLDSLPPKEGIEGLVFPPKLIVKFSPINLLDFDTPGFTFSLEHQLTEEHYMHHEISLLWGIHQRFEDSPMLGYRFRTGYRDYYRGLFDDGHSNPFIEYIFKFKQSFKKGTATFSRFDGLFQEELPSTMRATSVGIYIGYGRQYFLSSRLTLEWGFTVGWRWLQRQSLGVPNDADRIGFDFELGEGVFNFPSAYMLFKIGYVIK